MAEGKPSKKRINYEIKEIKTAIGNSWIKCRSQTHPGKFYYFDTLTGKAVWNLSDAENRKAQLHTMDIESQAGTNIGRCPEPTEPPADSPCSSGHQAVTQEADVPRIYNKQVINNQFAKSCATPSFVSPLCQCSSINSMRDVSANVSGPVYNPACPSLWTFPPPQQVFLARHSVTPLIHQAQPIFNNLHGPVQNTSGLTCRFQIVSSNRQCHPQTVNHIDQRTPSLTVRNESFLGSFHNKSNNDLRNVLSARRKDIKSDKEDEGWQETYRDHRNHFDEDDLYPSDIDDEWIEAKTVGEDTKLNIDMSSMWRLVSGRVKPDYWFIVTSSRVLLNHMKLLRSLINSDETILLLTPVEAVKHLRTATGSDDTRLMQRARRAVRFAIQQLHKVPDSLKKYQEGTLVNCCYELAQHNNYVVLLVDDKELHIEKQLDSIPIFTINSLKQYLTQKSYAQETGSRDKLTLRCSSSSDVTDSFSKDNTPLHQSAIEISGVSNIEKSNESNSIERKEIEIQTDQIKIPMKQTVNASVQTDLELKLSPQPCESAKSPSPVEIMGTDHTFREDTVVEPSIGNTVESSVCPKKITLKRNPPSAIKTASAVNKTTYKWRKKRITTPITLQRDAVPNKFALHPNSSTSSFLSTDLDPDTTVIHQSSNVVDCEKRIETSDETLAVPHDDRLINEETSTSGVISNSVYSDCMSSIDKRAITNESKDNEKRDIVMFEVTDDLLDEYLGMRCDEWVARFVQIMEEALTQILQQEPCFIDSTMPPPWSIYEATVCIKQKFYNNSNILHASLKLAAALDKISDRTGKIYADIKTSDFMHMFSYGVNLIDALQLVLKDSEDLRIATESLSKLLSDIRNPNSDASHVFIDDDTHKNTSCNTATVISHIVDVREDSPANKQEEVSDNNSSSDKYSLRSNRQKYMTEAESKSIQKIDNDLSFFTSLKLQKKNSSLDGCAIQTVSNRLQDETYESSSSQQNFQHGSIEVSTEDETKQTNPTIIRNFNRCLEIEEKLNSKKNNSLLLASEHFSEEDNCSSNDFYPNGNSDYAEETYYGGTSDGIDDKTSRSSGSDEIDVRVILKLFMQRTAYPIHRVLIKTHKFCKGAYKDLSDKGNIGRNNAKDLIGKTNKVKVHLDNLCKYLNKILHHEDMKKMFHTMMTELGFEDFTMSDSQVTEYRVFIGKYLEQATLLLESVNLIAAATKCQNDN